MKKSIQNLFAEAQEYYKKQQWQECINRFTKIIDSMKLQMKTRQMRITNEAMRIVHKEKTTMQ